jgi:hypothetical protein
LKALKSPKHPFEPPTPEPSTGETALAVGAGFGVIALDIVTAGFLSGLDAIPSLSRDPEAPIDLAPLLATIADTAAPVDDGEGNVQCTRCTQLVPYATMSLNEDGYFCAACVKAVVRETLGE